MKKLNFTEAASLMGGKNEIICAGLQAMVDEMIKDGATEAQWDEWEKEFWKNC